MTTIARVAGAAPVTPVAPPARTTEVREFRLPDLGEGLTESEIVQWHVHEGDAVELNQIIADVETAKAVVELPSPYAGVVVRLHVAAGATVDVGAPIVSFEVSGEAGVGRLSSSDGAGGRSPADDQDRPGAEAPARREPNLVGYGAAVETAGRPRRRGRSLTSARTADALTADALTADALTADALTADALTADALTDDALTAYAATAEALTAVGPSEDVTHAGKRPRSTPPVRKLARDLGISLDGLTGTGPGALVTRADVLGALSGTVEGPGMGAAPIRPPGTFEEEDPAAPAPDGVTRTPIKGMRRYTAAAMVASAFTAPHVTEFLTVDVTPTMELLAALKAGRAFEGTRVTPLTIVAKAVCLAVRRNPSVNSSWDEQAQEIVQYRDVNLGIAAATPRGLLVPNIKGAQALQLIDLARALGSLADTARAGRTPPADLAGGTISITNIGVFGIDAGTPILNPGEAAILAMGAVRRTPWEYRDAVALRSVMTLSLSFDHRLVDGEQGSRFLADVGTILSSPAMVLTMV